MRQNWNKRFGIGLLLIVMILTSCSSVNAEIQAPISVEYNGDQIIFDTDPVIVNGRTMVPLRAVFEALGMNVKWESTEQRITASKEGLEIVLYIGVLSANVNDAAIVIDTKPYINSGRTLVPLRFIAESTGADVEWDETNRKVIITDQEHAAKEILYTYKVVDTGLKNLFTDAEKVGFINEDEAFYGQDGNYNGYQPEYVDNEDGTVTDMVTGLMWQQTMDEKVSFDETAIYANDNNLGGYTDWRVPTIKELFSLILYTGSSGGEKAGQLFIDTNYFDQPIGDVSIGEREIDAQVWSATEYVGTTMMGDSTVFGVNFVDGRIKGYPTYDKRSRTNKLNYVRLVRGNTSYGDNILVDNGDGTASDLATGLMWQLADDGIPKDWEEALSYAEELELAGYTDWRLPNVKELQSIVDYNKSMQTTGTAAIDDMFVLTLIEDPNGEENYGFYWSGTTHQDGPNAGGNGSYVAFGEAQGEMFEKVLDVHGAGAVRSDPKSGSRSDYPSYFGPQGDVRYVYNYVIAVRDMMN